MVYFSCDGCGDVLKKNQVDAHAQRCRRCVSVSCADCLVSFFGDDYRGHTTCLTEVERYEKKGQKQDKKRKQSPQEVWMDTVQSSVESAPAHLKQLLRRIAELDNIPRKPKQFMNFAANSLKLRNGDSTVSEIWDFLKSTQEGKRTTALSENNDKTEPDDKKSPETSECQQVSVSAEEQKNAQPTEDKAESTAESSTRKVDLTTTKSKDVRKAMRKVLKKSTGKSLDMKLLSEKVRLVLGLSKGEEKPLRKLVKKAASGGKKFTVDNMVVTLKVD